MHLGEKLLYLYFAAAAAWILSEMWIFIRERNEAKGDKDRNSRRIVVYTIFIAMIFGGVIAPRFTHIEIFPTRLVGLLVGTAVMAAGISMRVWSVLTLGRFFRTTVMVQEGHVVIQHGIYKFIRHPSYSAILIIVTGLGIALNNLVALAGMDLIILFGLLRRINIEEGVLSSELASDYRDYMKHTKRLIPFIY